jgi:hypothetical protein
MIKNHRERVGKHLTGADHALKHATATGQQDDVVCIGESAAERAGNVYAQTEGLKNRENVVYIYVK